MQSVMRKEVFRSNLMGCQRTDHGYTKWCWWRDRKSAGRSRRPSTFKYTWNSCTHTVSALSTRRALPFWIIPVRPMTPTWFWGWHTGPTEITLADGREWKCMDNMCISQSNSWLLCSILLYPVSLWFKVSAVQIEMMDRLNEGWSLHTMYICLFCVWLNLAKVCGSVLVWNTYTTHIFLRIHRFKYKQPRRWMDYWWSLKERALKTHTVFLHASWISEINICMRLNYIV